MAHAFRLYATGGPDVMRWEEVGVGETGCSPGTYRSGGLQDSWFYGPVAVPNTKGSLRCP